MRILGQWMERNRAVSLLLCALLLAAGPALARERKILQLSATDPQNRAADAWLDQTAGSQTANHGGDTTLRVTSQSGTRNQRTLVQFDLSSVPSSGIKVATLSLWMSTAPPTGHSRTYGAYRMTSLWTESGASWTNRALCLLSCTPSWTATWTTAGGDSAAATSTTATGTASNVFLTWDIAADVRQWYGGNTPSANYGTMIRDNTESSGTVYSSVFSSKEDATAAHRPSLTLDFIQNVQGLTTTAGSARVTLGWTYPPQVSGSTVLSPTNGVLILRGDSSHVPNSTVAPTDGATYTACTTPFGTTGPTVVFSNTALRTTFDDSAAGDNPGCPPANNTTYFYKVFTRDQAGDFSQNNGAANPSIYNPVIVATPNAAPSQPQAVSWMASTGTPTLSAPGIIPSNVVLIGAPSSIISGIKPSDGRPVFGWVSVGGAITGRPPVLEGTYASIAHNVAYIASGDGFVYAVDAANGDIIWMTNPTALTTNGFTAGPAVVVKTFNDALGGSYSRMTDLVVVGTRSGSTSTNQVVGIDGNSGAAVWTLTGGGTNPAMDLVAATPSVDYKNNAIWVTSHSNAVTTQPSLWKININTAGPVATALATANLGNISNSPIVTFTGDVLFVGNDAGTLYAMSTAINTANPPPLASFAAGDTQVVGSPALLTNSSPYTVVFSGATTVKAVIFNLSTKTFTTAGAGTWSTAMPGGCAPSAPIGFPGLAKIYVGCGDGNLYQLDATTGTIDGTRILHPGNTVGDPTLDVELSRIIAGNTNSRVYAYTFPF